MGEEVRKPNLILEPIAEIRDERTNRLVQSERPDGALSLTETRADRRAGHRKVYGGSERLSIDEKTEAIVSGKRTVNAHSLIERAVGRPYG